MSPPWHPKHSNQKAAHGIDFQQASSRTRLSLVVVAALLLLAATAAAAAAAATGLPNLPLSLLSHGRCCR